MNRILPKFDSSHCKTDEEFLAFLKEWNANAMFIGVQQGWWADVDERGNPIPHPQIFKISEHPTLATVVVELGIFKSVTQARKNGFDKPSSLGIHTFTKKKIRARIIEE